MISFEFCILLLFDDQNVFLVVKVLKVLIFKIIILMLEFLLLNGGCIRS